VATVGGIGFGLAPLRSDAARFLAISSMSHWPGLAWPGPLIPIEPVDVGSLLELLAADGSTGTGAVTWLVLGRSSAVPTVLPANSRRAMPVTAKMLARRPGQAAFRHGASSSSTMGFAIIALTRCETGKRHDSNWCSEMQ
jgi:hypothetical protein